MAAHVLLLYSLKHTREATQCAHTPLACLPVEREGGGRRLRESVFDNAEPASQQAEEAGEDGAWEEQQQEEPRARDPSPGDAGGSGSKRRSRRERGSSRGDGAAGDDGGAPPPEPWSEWGPSEEVPPDAEEWGWASESWVPDSSDYDGARAGPSRRRGGGGSSRRERGGYGDDDGDAYARSSGYPEAELEGEDLDEDEEGYDDDGSYEEERTGGGGGGFAPPRRATASANRRSAGDDSSSADGGGASAEPDIALLSPAELDSVLPVIPFPQQAAFYNGSATDAVQRWAASLALTVLISKVGIRGGGGLGELRSACNPSNTYQRSPSPERTCWWEEENRERACMLTSSLPCPCN